MTIAETLAHHPQPPDDAAVLTRALEALAACQVVCSTCADACLAENGVADLRTCIRTDLDCADVCAATARVLSRARASDVVAQSLLAACVAACRACATECEQHAGVHEHCRACAEACRRCADACEDLLAQLGGAQP